MIYVFVVYMWIYDSKFRIYIENNRYLYKCNLGFDFINVCLFTKMISCLFYCKPFDYVCLL